MITTTYETSKRLRDAGVRIKAMLSIDTQNTIYPAVYSWTIPAPTFTELVEWLKGKGFAIKCVIGLITWVDCDPYNSSDGRFIKENKNLTEAAAECCLEVAKREAI